MLSRDAEIPRYPEIGEFIPNLGTVVVIHESDSCDPDEQEYTVARLVAQLVKYTGATTVEVVEEYMDEDELGKARDIAEAVLAYMPQPTSNIHVEESKVFSRYRIAPGTIMDRFPYFELSDTEVDRETISMRDTSDRHALCEA